MCVFIALTLSQAYNQDRISSSLLLLSPRVGFPLDLRRKDRLCGLPL